MLDQLFGLVLLGLGVQSPVSSPAVLGDDEEAVLTVTPTPYMIDGIPSNVSPERREMYKKEMERRKGELEAKRKEVEAQYKEKREALKTQFTENKDVYRTQKRNPEEFRSNVAAEKEAYLEAMKAKIEQSKADHETRLADFKEKMRTFKDQGKKRKVEDIQARISAFVAKRIETMTAHITKMNDIVGLTKIQVSEKAVGKDTSAFDTAASAALIAINTAKDKISTIATKQYVVTVSSESTIKSDVDSVRKTVEIDVKAAAELMKNARVAVSTMLTERAKLLGETIPDAVIK